jgi:ethanolamine ammonia-lyase small subunit
VTATKPVHEPLDVDSFAAAVAEVGLGAPTVVRSRAGSRSEYLRRPDLGRLPGSESLAAIPGGEHQVGFVLADGLSPRALTDHGLRCWRLWSPSCARPCPWLRR